MKNYDYLHTSRYGKSKVEDFLKGEDDDSTAKPDTPYRTVNELSRKRIRPMSYSHAFWEDVEKYFAHIDLPKENTKMYTITRPGKGMPRSLSGVKFPSYEKARQAIRKWVRSNLGKEGYFNKVEAKSDIPWLMWDSTSRNPTNVVSALGFKIKSTTGV